MTSRTIRLYLIHCSRFFLIHLGPRLIGSLLPLTSIDILLQRFPMGDCFSQCLRWLFLGDLDRAAIQQVLTAMALLNAQQADDSYLPCRSLRCTAITLCISGRLRFPAQPTSLRCRVALPDRRAGATPYNNLRCKRTKQSHCDGIYNCPCARCGGCTAPTVGIASRSGIHGTTPSRTAASAYRREHVSDTQKMAVAPVHGMGETIRSHIFAPLARDPHRRAQRPQANL